MILGLPLIGTRSSRKVTIPPRRKQTAETPAAPTKPTISGPFWTGKKSAPDLPKPQGVVDARQEQMIERARKRLSKRAKRGFRGYPIATVALYGPDDRAATKLTVGIVRRNMPRPQILGAGSPKGPISAMMPLWHKKCSRSSRRPELGPS